MDVVSNCTMELFRRSYLFFIFYYKVARELGANSFRNFPIVQLDTTLTPFPAQLQKGQLEKGVIFHWPSVTK